MHLDPKKIIRNTTPGSHGNQPIQSPTTRTPINIPGVNRKSR